MSEEIKRISGSISPEGQVDFGESAIVLEPPINIDHSPVPPTGVFGPLLTALDEKRQWEYLFPMHVFSEKLQAAIMDIAFAKATNPATVAGVILGAAAGMIGRARGVIVKQHEWEECANLYMLHVAPSGAGKSHLHQLIYKPVFERELKVKTQYRKDREEYEKIMRERMKKKGTEGKEPVPPINTQYMLDDSTIEAAFELLDDNPRGLCWLIDEMLGFFNDLDRYNKSGSGSGKNKILSAFSRKTVCITRKKQNGISNDKYIPHATISIFGGIQPKALPQLFTKIDQHRGLDARFLYIPDLEVNFQEEEYEISTGTIELWKYIANKLLDLDVTHTEDKGPETQFISMNYEAREVFNAFQRNANFHAVENEDIFAYVSKLYGITVRIALILHCLKYAENGQSVDTPLELETMQSAIDVTIHYIWNLRKIWTYLNYADEESDKATNNTDKNIVLRRFIDSNRELAGSWLILQEILDAGLKLGNTWENKSEFTEYLTNLGCKTKKSNGKRYHLISLIEKWPNFGIEKNIEEIEEPAQTPRPATIPKGTGTPKIAKKPTKVLVQKGIQ